MTTYSRFISTIRGLGRRRAEYSQSPAPEGMNLKDFVADAIYQIHEGVLEAIEKHDARGAIGRINPVFRLENGDRDWKSAIVDVAFDVTVTTVNKSSGDGGFSAQIHVINLNTKMSSAVENTSSNKIKFTIPIALPSHGID